MELSASESELYQKICRILTDREAIGELKNEDVSTEDIHSLLQSEKSDLSRLGLDLLSLIPSPPNARDFSDNRQVAGNFLRFFLAREASGSNSRELQDQVNRVDGLLRDLLRVHRELQRNPEQERRSGYPAGESTTVIVHGTWSNPPIVPSSRPYWWEPKGDFWTYINDRTKDVYAGGDYFHWSGDNSDKERMKAAAELAAWCKRKGCQNLRGIAHSHGGNVAMYASRLGLKIDHLILLGTPIRVDYIPNLSNINKLTNVFSTGDVWQKRGTFPVHRNEGRTLADSDKVFNLQATQNGSLRGFHPDHGDLHKPDTWNASQLNTIL